MRSNFDLMAPRLLVVSWLAAAVAYPLTLMTAVLGQGLGALAGGCGWIGLSLPVDRQVWALVNQPVLNFASLPMATGYWLGSLALPLAVGTLLLPLMPRPRSLAVELAAVHIAWTAAALGVAWLPVLDMRDGHFTRWLALHGMPSGAVWLTPVVGAGIVLLPTIRLLQLARRYRPHSGRSYRLVVVCVHLILPFLLWVALAFTVHGSLIVSGIVAAALVATTGFVFAWFRYPAPFVQPLRELSPRDVVVVAAVAAVLAVILWLGGRPLEGGRSAGLQWGNASAFNNVRPWIDATVLSLAHP